MLALRSFCVVVALFAMGRGRLSTKIVALASYGAILWAAMYAGGFEPVTILLPYAYLFGVAGVPYVFRGLLRGRVVIFVSVALMFVCIPAVLPPLLRATTILLGWEAMLSAYSYFWDERDEARSSFGDYVFFVLVNPVLVYADRGVFFAQRSASMCDVRRVLAGAIAVGCSGAVTVAVAAAPRATFGVGIAVTSISRLLGVYLAHTGLANIQIGLMRPLGWTVPERYVRPLTAESPADFWRKWNTYVGSWVRRYVFQPVFSRVRSRIKWDTSHSRRTMMAYGMSVFCSFLFIGALHDMYASLVSHTVSCWGVAWFAANGLIVILWETAARIMKLQSTMRFTSALSRVAFVVVAFALFWFVP